jgi:hypothetical protein
MQQKKSKQKPLFVKRKRDAGWANWIKTRHHIRRDITK